MNFINLVPVNYLKNYELKTYFFVYKRCKKMATPYELGKKGEQIACEFLIRKGFEILETNYRYQKAEVDIIAQKENKVAVIEVKTRNTDYFGNPQDFVNTKKIKLLVQAINNYVNDNDLDVDIRFDIIAVLFQKEKYCIEHLEDAFLYFDCS